MGNHPRLCVLGQSGNNLQISRILNRIMKNYYGVPSKSDTILQQISNLCCLISLSMLNDSLVLQYTNLDLMHAPEIGETDNATARSSASRAELSCRPHSRGSFELLKGSIFRFGTPRQVSNWFPRFYVS